MLEEIELEEVKDENFLALVLAFAKSNHGDEIAAAKAYRLVKSPGWKVDYDYYPGAELNYAFEVSPEQLYGWMWKNSITHNS